MSWNGVPMKQFGKHRTIPTVHLTCADKKLRIYSFKCTSKQNLGGFHCCGNFLWYVLYEGYRILTHWQLPHNMADTQLDADPHHCGFASQNDHSHSHWVEWWCVHLLQYLQFMKEIIKNKCHLLMNCLANIFKIWFLKVWSHISLQGSSSHMMTCNKHNMGTNTNIPSMKYSFKYKLRERKMPPYWVHGRKSHGWWR